jgi:hypothetical protein
MAIRYWVGGSGTWDASSTANWSTSSGGASGASVPGAADTVLVDANSGSSFTITLGADASITFLTISITASSATLNLGGYNLTTSNTCTLSGYAVVNVGTGALTVFSLSQSGANSNVSVNTGVLTCTSTYTFTGGTLNLNTGTITCSAWNSPSGTRTINWNTSGTIYVTGPTTLVQAATGMTVTNGPGRFYHSGTGLSNLNIGSFSESTAPNLVATGALTWATATTQTVKDFQHLGTGLITYGATIYGDLTLSSGTTQTSAGFTMGATSATKTLTTNGGSLLSLTVSGSGSTFNLVGNLTAGSFALSQGTFNASSYNINVTTFNNNGSSTRALNMGSGTWTIGGGFNQTTTGLTFNAQTSTINLTLTSSFSFAGNGLTYYNLNKGATGTMVITGSNTFNNISSSASGAATISFTAGTTQTVSNFTASGTAGNLLTLKSQTAGSKFYLSKTSGTVSIDYVSIIDSTASSGTNWYAGANSTDAGNNTGWMFSRQYTVGGQFLDVISFSDE